LATQQNQVCKLAAKTGIPHSRGIVGMFPKKNKKDELWNHYT
jgi:hypothetical protein